MLHVRVGTCGGGISYVCSCLSFRINFYMFTNRYLEKVQEKFRNMLHVRHGPNGGCDLYKCSDFVSHTKLMCVCVCVCTNRCSKDVKENLRFMLCVGCCTDDGGGECSRCIDWCGHNCLWYVFNNRRL
jgi:hypothetical protein